MNLDRLICVGLSHQTAPVALREQLSQWPLLDLRTPALEELVIVRTCNRLELYAYLAEAPTPDQRVYQPLVDLMTTTQGVSAAALEGHLYHFTGEAVCDHLCRVAAGLESLIMGEGQILGQVNSALQQAYAVKSVGPMLGLLFRTAIKAGKRARTETKINANPVSISSAALTLAAQVAGDLRHQHIALVGLGEIGQLALKGLYGRGVTTFSLVNRTFARATELAALYGGQPYTMADLPTVLQTADIVITATSAAEPILHRAQVAAAGQDRGERPLTLIDLAVPRNIESAVATLPMVTLYDVDDLRTVVDNALAARQAELPQVKAIITELLEEWHQQVRELALRPVVVGLRQQAEQVRRQAVARTLRHLEREQGEIDAGTAAQLAHLSRALVNQLLHRPTVKLKQKAGQAEGTTYAALLCELFDLDIPLPDEDTTGRAFPGELTDNNEINNDEQHYNLHWIVDDTAQAPVGDYYPCPAGGEGLCTAHADGLYCLPIRADKTAHYEYELVGQP